MEEEKLSTSLKINQTQINDKQEQTNYFPIQNIITRDRRGVTISEVQNGATFFQNNY